MTNIPNIDDIILKAKDLAQKAGKKTEELAEAGKLKINVITLKAELRKKLTEIGEYVFSCAMKNEEQGEALQKLISEAADLQAQIEALEKELSQSGKKKVCAACGEINDSDKVFCENCGNML